MCYPSKRKSSINFDNRERIAGSSSINHQMILVTVLFEGIYIIDISTNSFQKSIENYQYENVYSLDITT